MTENKPQGNVKEVSITEFYKILGSRILEVRDDFINIGKNHSFCDMELAKKNQEIEALNRTIREQAEKIKQFDGTSPTAEDKENAENN